MADQSVGRREFVATASTLAVAGCVGGRTSQQFQMAVVPDVDPETAVQQNTELKSYLGNRLDTSVSLSTTSNYSALVRAMTAGEVDLAYFGGVSYILAHIRGGAEAVIVGSKDGSTEWHSAFVVPSSSAYSSLSDLKPDAGDVDLVFGDPISTSGTVMPTYYLRTKYDLRPKQDFASVTHVGAHDATARAIAAGNGDLGALNARIYDALREDGQLDGDVTEIWRSPGFPDYPWAVAPSVSEDRKRAIQEAFVSLDENDRDGILDKQNVDKYVRTSHEQFTSLEEAVRMAGILDEPTTEP